MAKTKPKPAQTKKPVAKLPAKTKPPAAGHQTAAQRDMTKVKNAETSPSATAQELAKLMAYKRPHGSDGERAFGKGLVARLTEIVSDRKLFPEGTKVFVDGFKQAGDKAGDLTGNIHVDLTTIESKDKPSRTLFSCHIDTVHRDDGTQQVLFDPIANHLLVEKGADCLGADDACGVLIMIDMIMSGVPGYYIFHRGEEVGGLGSGWLRTNRHDLLTKFDRAIAFDRKGTGDIINYQRGGRCASDEFCKALAKELDAANKSFKFGMARGSFTDTANYTTVIAECTNISVGYYAQHSQNEYVDIAFFEKLMDAVKTVNWETLPVKRDPLAVPEYKSPRYGYNYGVTSPPARSKAKKKTPVDTVTFLDARFIIRRYPDIAARLLVDNNIAWHEVDTELMNDFADRFMPEDGFNDDLMEDDPDYAALQDMMTRGFLE